MDTNLIKNSLAQAKQSIDAALAEVNQTSNPPPTPLPGTTPVVVTSPEMFDAAITSNVPIITLSKNFVYPRSVTLARSVTIQSEVIGSGRATKTGQLPVFQQGVRALGDTITLKDIGVQHTIPTTDVLVLGGAHAHLQRVRVLGDPVKGGKRGIAANGSDMLVEQSYIDDMFQPAQDTQAICSWDMGGGLTILDSYLGGGSQSLMFGGSDAASVDRIPRTIHVKGCTLSKNPAWFSNSQIKCSLEFKDAIDVVIEDSVFEYGGTAQGQGAYLIVATPRNQGGKAPWSTIKNIVIKNCTGGNAGGILNMLGTDNDFPSGPLDTFTLQDCSFTNIDPKGITGGQGRLFMFDRSPKNVTLSNIQVAGANIAALGYFSGAAPTGLKISGMKLPASKYGWKIDGGGSGAAALKAYAPDIQLDSTVV